MNVFLSDGEIADICAPLTMPAAQRRYLERLGMVVKAKPNGRPLLARGEFDRVMIGAPPMATGKHSTREPNREALLRVLSGGKRGT